MLAPYYLGRSHCFDACAAVAVSVAVAVAANNPRNPYHEESGNDCRLLSLVRLDMPDCRQPDLPDLPPIECPSSTPGEYASLIYPVILTYLDLSRSELEGSSGRWSMVRQLVLVAVTVNDSLEPQ